MQITVEQLKSLRLYLDGSDGSMWPVNDNGANWELVLSDEHAASRRYIRVSDLLRCLPNPNWVTPVGESPVDLPVAFPVAPQDGPV